MSHGDLWKCDAICGWHAPKESPPACPLHYASTPRAAPHPSVSGCLNYRPPSCIFSCYSRTCRWCWAKCCIHTRNNLKISYIFRHQFWANLDKKSSTIWHYWIPFLIKPKSVLLTYKLFNTINIKIHIKIRCFSICYILVNPGIDCCFNKAVAT